MANTKVHIGSGLTGNIATISATTATFSFLPHLQSQNSGTTSTEARANLKLGFAGTFSRLGFGQTSASGTATIRFRKNTANGNQTKTSTASTNAWFEDAVNTDAVAVNDLIDVQWTGTATLPLLYGLKAIFDGGASGLINLPGNDNFLLVTLTGTFFNPIFARGAQGSATEANNQHKIRAPGTLSYFQACASGGASQACTLTLRKNGANANSAVTLTNNTTGVFVDTTHTDTLASGDLVAVGTSALSSGTVSVTLSACIAQSAGTYDWGGGFFGARAASATSNFYTPKGSDTSASTTTVGYPISYSNTGKGFLNARIQISANTYTASVTWQFRKNNANANNACTITNATTGWFEDTTHTDTFADGDKFDYLLTGGSSGSLTIQTYAITIDNGTDAPVAPPWPNFLLNQIAAVGY